LRAFFRLASLQQEKEKQIGFSKKIKNCYHVLGNIRDLQLQQNGYRHYPFRWSKTLSYLDLVKKEIVNHKSDLHKLDIEKSLVKSRKKTNAYMPKNFSPDAYGNFVQKKWDDIDAIIFRKILAMTISIQSAKT
jgi:hypothetical protein